METNTYSTISIDFDPFAQGELARTIQVTESQQEIWVACQLGGTEANCAYNESISLILRGTFQQEAMSQALQELLNRHEALRSTFSADGDHLCVQAESQIDPYYQDLSSLPADEQVGFLAAYGITDAETAFDLENGPLFRVAIFKIRENEHQIRLTAHHLVCDGWSFGIILEDLASLYSAYAQSLHPEIRKPDRFSEYVDYLASLQGSQEYKQSDAYWAKQFESPYTPFEIPIDFPRPSTRTYKSDRVDFALDNMLVEALISVGKSHASSLVTVLLTAFEAYIHRLSSQEDLVIGLATAGQSVSGYNHLVGHCVNLLPVRSTPSGKQTYSEYLRKRNGEIMDTYDHPHLTLGKLLKSLNIARDGSQVPLTPIVFNVDISMGEQLAFHELEHTLVFNPRRYENFELFLNITRAQGAFVLEWSYNKQLFTASTIKRMMAEFECLLQSIAALPEQPIAALNILTGAQLEQLEHWNETTQDLGSEQLFAEIFDKTARQLPNNVSVTFKDSQLTYHELEIKSNQFAHVLIERGVKKGDKIGLAIDRSENLIVALIGMMKAGAVYLPFDINLPAGRVSGILEEAATEFLLTSHEYAGRYNHPGQEIYIEPLLEQLAQFSIEKPAVEINGDDLVYILHTSGSTGKPKGVQIMHKNMANFLKSMQVRPGIHERDKVLAITPISFDMAVVLYLPLVTGSELVLADVETSKDGRLLHEMLISKQISWMIATPSTWEMIISAGWDTPLDLLAISAGEALGPKLAKQLLERCTTLWNGYGPTETAVMILMKQIISHEQPITLGKPLANTKIYILDRYGNRVPAGHHGEIYITGANVGAGYYGQPGLTEQAFVANPFRGNINDKMYRTGDLGRYTADGDIHYLGRIDNQVKIRGHRIELGEIEHTLASQNGIKEAVVLAVEDHKGDKNLVAYLVQDTEDATGWKDRWEDLYELGVKSEEDVPLEDQNLDIAIISQYYTSGEIEEQGAEWTNEGLKRIQAINAKKIIELGTGGGHLMQVLGPDAEEYIATDYSEVAINKLNEKLANHPEKWAHAKAYTAMADDFTGIEPHQYDLVFLHGVAQYFPNLHYLQKVIKNATLALRDGGCIFIGDMQTLGAISMHFYLDQLDITSDNTTIKEFKEITELRIKKEEELSVDPEFFYNLPATIPAITSVNVQIRGGNYLNEGTKCHYDIWMYVGETAPKAEKPAIHLEWNASASSQWLHQQLKNYSGQVIRIDKIPNSRLSRDFALLQLVNQSDDRIAIKELKHRMQSVTPSGFNPTDLWSIGEELGYKTHVRWAVDGSDGCVEAVFIPTGHDAIPERPPNPQASSVDKVSDELLEDIQIVNAPEHQVKKWKNAVQGNLPEYMVPTFYIALNRFPLSTNGKIDKNRLPKPDLVTKTTSSAHFKAPSTQTEKLLHGIWAKYLELENISVTSNFFELGGHSLIAVKIMLDVEKETGSRIPISSLFEHSTIEKLARAIDGNEDPLQWDCVIPIRKEGSKPPLYIVHGALLDILYIQNIVPFLDADQPVYGIQGVGLSGKTKPVDSVNKIAARYVSELLSHTPNGPFALAGYSSGGILAFEMSRQLTKLGKTVFFVGLFDTYMTKPQRGFKNNIRFWKTVLKEAFHQYGHNKTYALLFFIGLERIVKYTAPPMLDRISQKYFPADYRKFNAQIIHNVAYKNHTVEPFDIRTTLYRCSPKHSGPVSATNGWDEIIRQGLEIIPISSTHVNMFKPGNVHELSGKLQTSLNIAWDIYQEENYGQYANAL